MNTKMTFMEFLLMNLGAIIIALIIVGFMKTF